MLDEADKHGLPRQSFTGRREAAKIIKAPLLAPRSSAQHGNYFCQHAKVWAATRLVARLRAMPSLAGVE